jgi:hypothetical protein
VNSWASSMPYLRKPAARARETGPVCGVLDVIIMTATGPAGRGIPDPGAPMPV